MERQLLVAQLAVLLEEPTAQHRFRRQALPPGLLVSMPTQIGRHQPNQRRMLVKPLGYRLQLATDLVPGKKIE